MPYAPYFFSSFSRKAIHLPSGLHSGLPRPPRLVAALSAFSVDPAFASMTNSCADGSRSGSGLRLLVKAMRVPSGDHDGEPSSALPPVSRSSFFDARSNRWMYVCRPDSK